MSPSRLLEEFSGPELSEQLAFARIDPLPDDWWMMGQICTTIAQANSDGKTQFKPEMFIRYTRPAAPRQAQSEAEMKLRMSMFAAAFNARNRGKS